jgi:hypothetical protein
MPFKDEEKKKEYAKMYRENHKKYYVEYRRRYYRANRVKLNLKAKDNYIENKEECLERGRKRYAKYKDKIIAYQKERMKDPRVRERHNIQVKEYRKRDRLLVLGHYSNGKLECSCCKEKQFEFLTIHHINGGGRKHRMSDPYDHLYRWLMAHGLPKGYGVLCINCNMAMGLYGYCPHTRKNKS